MRRQGLAGHGGVELITDSYLYVAGLHVFLHKESGEILRPEAFVALHSHITDEIRDIVLSGEGVAKVTSLDFDPGMPETFTRNGATYYNTWTGLTTTGTPGDITPWWRHLCLLVPVTREREHLLNWMAYTVQHPEKKINHAVVMGGHFGIGKDTLFWPLDQLTRASLQAGRWRRAHQRLQRLSFNRQTDHPAGSRDGYAQGGEDDRQPTEAHDCQPT